jgi:hypothetical protein
MWDGEAAALDTRLAAAMPAVSERNHQAAEFALSQRLLKPQRLYLVESMIVVAIMELLAAKRSELSPGAQALRGRELAFEPRYTSL